MPSGHGPFIDTHRVDRFENRIYVSLEAFNEFERIFREAGVQTIGAERIALLEQLNEAQASTIERLRQVEAEHEKLKAAVKFTLEAGRGAVQKKDGTQQLRNLPGQRTVKV